jgi:hypothetical protein
VPDDCAAFDAIFDTISADGEAAWLATLAAVAIAGLANHEDRVESESGGNAVARLIVGDVPVGIGVAGRPNGRGAVATDDSGMLEAKPANGAAISPAGFAAATAAGLANHGDRVIPSEGAVVDGAFTGALVAGIDAVPKAGIICTREVSGGPATDGAISGDDNAAFVAAGETDGAAAALASQCEMRPEIAGDDAEPDAT